MTLNELPGAELILPGLEDLHQGETHTVGALLVAIASTRLSEAGLDIPKGKLASEPELTLYHRLQEEREDAYSYYNFSFKESCELLQCTRISQATTISQAVEHLELSF